MSGQGIDSGAGSAGAYAPATNGVPDDRCLVLSGISKFYGEVLGVNRVNLRLAPGVTSLVGPNGSGKSTMMNLMAGLVRPSAGQILMLGIPPTDPEQLFTRMGYCTQVDAFPRGMTGLQFVAAFQRIAGLGRDEAESRALRALERTGMDRVAHRKVAGYSKGMRQRVKLAQAIAHEPSILLLDEPLNGLDPLARAEIIELFQLLANEGLHLVISSHILHEVDMLADRIVVLDQGYVVAEGGIGEVRAEIDARPLQLVIRCDRPKELAARVLVEDHVTEIRITDQDEGFIVRTRDAGRFYALLQAAVVTEGFVVRSAVPTDDDAQAVYGYLVNGRQESE